MTKKVLAIMLSLVIMFTVVGCAGSSELPEKYYEVNNSFSGMSLKHYAEDSTSYNQAVNDMVYNDMPTIIMDDLNAKGNNITEIRTTYANGQPFHTDETVATIGLNITSNGGDIKSGEYTIAAFFTYDLMSDNKRIYFVNYVFINNEDEFINNNGAAIFEDSYNAVA